MEHNLGDSALNSSGQWKQTARLRSAAGMGRLTHGPGRHEVLTLYVGTSRCWEMPPELPRIMVPGWRRQRGGGQGLLHSLNQFSAGELSLHRHSRVLPGHTGGISRFKASVRVAVWQQQGALDPAARKCSCRSVPSQVDSAAELIFGKVFLVSLR